MPGKYSELFTVGYTIFNKEFLVEKIIDSIANLNGVPSIFLFDNCADNSLEVYLKNKDKLKNNIAIVNDGYDLFETLSNNYILRSFKTKYCMLFQDDLIMRNDRIFDLALEIYREESNVGVVGFRDGYNMEVADEYTDFVSSPYSHSKASANILEPGKYMERDYVNRGPISVSKEVIGKVGYFDELYYPIFWDDNDYCRRCLDAGLSNYIAFADIETDPSWGATRNGSKIPLKDIYIANRVKFAKKWGLKTSQQSMARTASAKFTSFRMSLKRKFLDTRYGKSKIRVLK